MEASTVEAEVSRRLAAVQPFATLPSALRDLLAADARERNVIAGELVVREGDVGDAFFVVASGSLQVVARAFDGTSLVLARIEPGQSFGEQSLIDAENRTRNATVRAVTACRLFVISRDALVRICDADASVRRHFVRIGASRQAVRDTLLREQVLRDLTAGAPYRIVHFEAGETVIREGDPGHDVYLILEGTARATHGDGDGSAILTDMLPGQFFGELAILNDAPRTASVRATSPLKVASIAGAWFRGAVSANPRLGSIMESLQAMYLLPKRGLLTLQGGKLGSQPTLMAVHHLSDGRQVASVRLVELHAFSARVLDAPEATASVQYRDAVLGARRALHLHDRRIVEIESEGPCASLGQLFERLLDGDAIDDADLAGFATEGRLRPAAAPSCDADELVCRCSRVSMQAIVAAIARGCTTVEAIASGTGATMVCGGCIPAVEELLGHGEWLPATCTEVLPLTDSVRAFRLRLPAGTDIATIPGQHVVLQVRIGGHWVERPYTVSSSGDGDWHQELMIKREPGGLLSRWLFDVLDRGVAMRVSLPRGDFCRDPDETVDVVFLAGGIGITPALAMARSLARRRGGSRLFVHHSVSSRDDALCRDELERIAAANEDFVFTVRTTGTEGRIDQDAVSRLVDRFPTARFYLCGSDGYVAAVVALLAAAGVDPDRIRLERFTPIG